jgi:hypothetical protein
MTSLLRGEDFSADSEQGSDTTGEDTRASGSERMRKESSVEVATRRRFAAGMSWMR